jgi:CheY-like chemotaxis protein
MLAAGRLEGAAAARALDVITRNAQAQIQLIDDMLDVARIVAGKMRLDVRPVDLTEVIQAALDAVGPAADAKEVRIQSTLDPHAVGVMGDPDRLQQVVWNLLINAVKFTPRGGRVHVHLRPIESHVEVSVSDTGQGIAPAMLPHLFERFRQAESGTTRSHGGLGLGLALVRHLVELHGGRVTAWSPGEGQGATFSVILPMPAVDTSRVDPRVHSRAGVPSGAGETPLPSLRGLRVLIIDDHQDSRDLVAAILGAAHAEARVCASAMEGFARLQDWRPDVLISDLEMPGEDGYSLIRRVRALDLTAGGRTPAIALTAYGRLEDRVRTLAAGYDTHMPKPVDATELATAVASLGRRGTA